MQDELTINSICRVCLRTKKGLGHLFEPFEEKQTIADILNECTKYQVERFDELPQQICKNCRLSAVNAFKFKQKCEQSYCKLVSQLQISAKNKIKLESIERTERYTQTEETSLNHFDHCNKKNFTYATEKLHAEKHQKKTIICRFCKKSFNRISYLETHIAVFHPEAAYQPSNSCHICKRQFTVLKHLHRHLSRVHKIEFEHEDIERDKKENEECDFQDDSSMFERDNNTNSENTQDNCLLELVNYTNSDEDNDIPLSAFQNSEEAEHSFLGRPTEQASVAESVKSEKNVVKQNIDSSDHVEKSIHKNNSTDKSPNSKLLMNQNEDHVFPCTICNKIFKKSLLLTEHINTRHGTSNKVGCTQCNKTFVNLFQYQRHTESKHNKPHECTICDKTFTSKIYLQRHINMHKKKRYVCKECTQNYATKEELNTHMKAEGHDKPLLCPECGLRCKTSNILTVHMRRHKGEKPFKCKFCSKGFPRMDDLRIHERYHTGEKSHFCETCGKGFQRKYNLTIHLRVHTGEKPYKCPHCPQAFAQGNDLKAHIRRHTGERFRCEHCDAAFLQGYQIRQHKLSEHGIREDPPTQRVAKFTSTEAQELQIKHNLQKELRALDENNLDVELDSLPIDVNEVSSLASDVIHSLEVSDFSSIHF